MISKVVNSWLTKKYFRSNWDDLNIIQILLKWIYDFPTFRIPQLHASMFANKLGNMQER